MTLTDPRSYPSREPVWMEHFRRRRRSELRPLVTESLLAELHGNPTGLSGDHSDALAQVLNFVKGETPMWRRAFVYVEAPHEAYRVAWMQGQGVPADVDGPVFSSEADAVVAVMKDRLRALGMWDDDEVTE